jgi:biopolymer transport protein ExbD
MRLRDPRYFKQPSFMIIPMIDVMFFLLVFFMMTSLSMVDLRTMGVQLPFASQAEQQPAAQYVVTLRRDGSLWLDDAPIDKETLLASAWEQQQKDSRFNVVVRADKGMDYGDVMALLDDFKRVGVVQLGLAAESGAEP